MLVARVENFKQIIFCLLFKLNQRSDLVLIFTLRSERETINKQRHKRPLLPFILSIKLSERLCVCFHLPAINILQPTHLHCVSN